MGKARAAGLFSGAIAAALAIAAPLQAGAAPDHGFADRVLAAHNRERARLGIAAMAWSPRLADEARQWAESLARRRAFEHSGNPGVGENLWMGTAGYYSIEQMVGGFVEEGRHFRAGTFPDVSHTGNWADIGHYSQLIWPDTRELGCALSRGGRNEVLVCRYWPAGNIVGQRVP